MKNTAIEKLSYTEVTKNISQAEYNQTQEEYILSKSPDKYMISLPVKVLMFEGAKDSSPFTYYFYMENDEDLYLMQRKRNGSVVDKTKIPLTKEQGQKILECIRRRRSCLSMRSTDSIKHNKITCCHL